MQSYFVVHVRTLARQSGMAIDMEVEDYFIRRLRESATITYNTVALLFVGR